MSGPPTAEVTGHAHPATILSGASAGPEGEFTDTLVVTGRADAASDVVVLTLRHPTGRELPAWQPGAHIDLLLDESLTRQYSLCGDPADRARWQIAVHRAPDGRGGSAYVHDALTEGAAVQVRGPRNRFPLRPAARYLFIAGGIGITPLVPMTAAAEAAGADWTLLYGGRTRASMAFADQLADRYGPKVRLVPQDESGLLDLASFLAAPTPDALVYCCGPEPLLRAAEERCRAWPSGSLRTERFQPRTDIPGPAAADGPQAATGSFELVLARSGLTLTVPPERSVLRAVEAAGISVLYSCGEGTCGTCETDVVEGEVDHRDSVLTDEERELGETMMICVSRCRGRRLVLDL
ncbi:iron-sulfur oxidoreductase subunit beta [Streptomyces bingchenggensis BCW-1]|uniref:Iron-sulfur oxidoreductase subunit beta n=1 Tax=Streptomyces bingchenggensis (strain BCW-1) TaxID=749414 RepID=D7BU10_STRBB|nr:MULTISPECIES: PDR/VanB family oxidoreductase [Streptomyces]ADI09579.1 iron-sulfur oxidoreductase subunit beta [Streptomyces bingchenggensis BCW-1]